MADTEYGITYGLNEGWQWGSKVITQDNPIKLKLITLLDRGVSAPSALSVDVPTREGFQTDEKVTLHPRFGRNNSAHWHPVPEVGRDVLLRQYDILHVKNAEGKITKRAVVNIFPIAQNPDNSRAPLPELQ